MGNNQHLLYVVGVVGFIFYIYKAWWKKKESEVFLSLVLKLQTMDFTSVWPIRSS